MTNIAILVGRLIKKPELKVIGNDKQVCEFTLAVDRPRVKDREKETDFINCTVWGKQADNLVKYQDKGSLILVHGSTRVDQYNDKDGNVRYKNYILTDTIQFLGSKPQQTVSTSTQNMSSSEIIASVASGNDPFETFGNKITLNESQLPF